jgi:hypothetical protein
VSLEKLNNQAGRDNAALFERILFKNCWLSSSVTQGLQVDQFFDPGSVGRGKMGELNSRKRVTGKDGFFNMQTIHELANILRESVGVIACFGSIGIAVSAAGESQYTESVGKARGKFIEDVAEDPVPVRKINVGPFPPQSR